MNINLPIGAKGRFKIIRHTGHKFDSEGSVVEFGRVLDETPFIDNVFTYFGSAALLNPGSNELSVEVSTSATLPTLDGYGPMPPGVVARKSTQLVSSSNDRRADPDENGMVWWRATYRFTFPQLPEGQIVEFRQVAALISTSSAINGVTEAPGSIAMLQGPDGSDSSLRLDMGQEAFDVVWEFTEYVLAESSGVVTIRYLDGNNTTLNQSAHTWIVRPANFDNTSNAGMGWRPITGKEFPNTSIGAIGIGTGTIGFVDTQPLFDESFGPDSATRSRLGMTTINVSVSLGFDKTTADEVIDCAQFMLNHSEWQVAFYPPIRKQERHLFNMVLAVTVNDRDRFPMMARLNGTEE